MKIWSVELEANSWNDDTFNGTFEECVDYCKKYDYKINGIEARLAELEVINGLAMFCYDIINELE